MTEPIISNTRTLKRKIIDRFSDNISVYPEEKYLIVHSSNIDPCEYVLAILKGKGLKDYEIIKSFGEMIRRKIQITAEGKQSHYLEFTLEFFIPYMENM